MNPELKALPEGCNHCAQLRRIEIFGVHGIENIHN
jgi:hypothetical protein